MSKKNKKGSKRKSMSKALQARIKKGQQRSSGKSVIAKDNVPRWSPKDGEHIIDILPYSAGKNDPDVKKGTETYTLQYSVHRNVGPAKGIFICLAEVLKKPCPICEHRQTLIDKGADDEVWKALIPKNRNMYNVICYDRGEEEKGVQVWDVPYFYSEKNLLAIASKPTRGGGSKFINFPDPVDGKSITFKITPPASKSDFASYEGYSFEDREYELKMKLLDGVYVLDEIIHIPTYDELSEAFFGEGGKPSGDDDGEPDDIPDEKEEGDSLEDIMEELDECEDLEDLEEFIEDHDFDDEIKIKKKSKFKKVKVKLEALTLEKYGEKETEKEEDDRPNKKQLKKMDFEELEEVIEKYELDVDPDDFDEDEDDEVKDMRKEIVEELDL
jgi:hypothetical protein